MKRLCTSLIILGICSATLSALPDTSDPSVNIPQPAVKWGETSTESFPVIFDPSFISIPQLAGGWVIGAAASFLRPSPTNGDLDFYDLSGGTSPTFFSDQKSVDADFDWAWGLTAGYIFPRTGNDINLTYFHFDSADTEDFDDTVQSLRIEARAEYDLDQLDLTGGQVINVGCRLRLHPSAGLRWAEFNRNIVSVASTLPLLGDFAAAGFKSSLFGIGPVIGIDGNYHIANGLGLVGHFDSALLAASINSSLEGLATDADLQTINFLLDARNVQRVAPVLDAKLGFIYTYMINNSEDSDLTFELGWQFNQYFNVVDRVNFQEAPFNSTRITSNVAMQGPYISMVYHA